MASQSTSPRQSAPPSTLSRWSTSSARERERSCRRAKKRRCLESDVASSRRSFSAANEKPTQEATPESTAVEIPKESREPTFHLFRNLAPELRNKVYKEIAKNTTLILPPCKARSLAPAMLLVSKQVAAEFRGILFSHAKLLVPVNKYDFGRLIKTIARMPKIDLEMLRERDQDAPNPMMIQLSLYTQEPCTRHEDHRTEGFQVEKDGRQEASRARNIHDASHYGCICEHDCECHKTMDCTGTLDNGQPCEAHQGSQCECLDRELIAGSKEFVKLKEHRQNAAYDHHSADCCCAQRKHLGFAARPRLARGWSKQPSRYNDMVRRIIDWRLCDDHLNIAWSYTASTDIRSRAWEHAAEPPTRPHELLTDTKAELAALSTLRNARGLLDQALGNLLAHLELSFERLSEQKQEGFGEFLESRPLGSAFRS